MSNRIQKLTFSYSANVRKINISMNYEQPPVLVLYLPDEMVNKTNTDIHVFSITLSNKKL